MFAVESWKIFQSCRTACWLAQGTSFRSWKSLPVNSNHSETIPRRKCWQMLADVDRCWKCLSSIMRQIASRRRWENPMVCSQRPQRGLFGVSCNASAPTVGKCEIAATHGTSGTSYSILRSGLFQIHEENKAKLMSVHCWGWHYAPMFYYVLLEQKFLSDNSFTRRTTESHASTSDSSGKY